jgi:hypothetical protein
VVATPSRHRAPSLNYRRRRDGCQDPLFAPFGDTRANNRSVADSQPSSRACRLARPFERSASRIRREGKLDRHRAATCHSSGGAASSLPPRSRAITWTLQSGDPKPISHSRRALRGCSACRPQQGSVPRNDIPHAVSGGPDCRNRSVLPSRWRRNGSRRDCAIKSSPNVDNGSDGTEADLRRERVRRRIADGRTTGDSTVRGLAAWGPGPTGLDHLSLVLGEIPAVPAPDEETIARPHGHCLFVGRDRGCR